MTWKWYQASTVGAANWALTRLLYGTMDQPPTSTSASTRLSLTPKDTRGIRDPGT